MTRQSFNTLRLKILRNRHRHRNRKRGKRQKDVNTRKSTANRQTRVVRRSNRQRKKLVVSGNVINRRKNYLNRRSFNPRTVRNEVVNPQPKKRGCGCGS